MGNKFILVNGTQFVEQTNYSSMKGDYVIPIIDENIVNTLKRIPHVANQYLFDKRLLEYYNPCKELWAYELYILKELNIFKIPTEEIPLSSRRELMRTIAIKPEQSSLMKKRGQLIKKKGQLEQELVKKIEFYLVKIPENIFNYGTLIKTNPSLETLFPIMSKLKECGAVSLFDYPSINDGLLSIIPELTISPELKDDFKKYLSKKSILFPYMNSLEQILTDAESKDIEEYKMILHSISTYTISSADINDFSRYGTSQSPYTLSMVTHLDYLFDYLLGKVNANRTRSVRLFRGIHNNTKLSVYSYEEKSKKYITSEKIITNLVNDDIFFDKGFISFALDLEIAGGFGRSGCYVSILYPPFLPFLPMISSGKNVLETSRGFTETELLLPRNLHFRVVSIKYIIVDGTVITFVDKMTENARTFIECEIVYAKMEIGKRDEKQLTIVNNIKEKKQNFLVNKNIDDLPIVFQEYIKCAMSSLYYFTTIERNEAFKLFEMKYVNEFKKIKKSQVPWYLDANCGINIDSIIYGGKKYYYKYKKYKTKYYRLNEMKNNKIL